MTCFALTGDVVFKDKAQQIADKLLPAFQTPTGIPNALVNFKTGVRLSRWEIRAVLIVCVSYRTVKIMVGPVEVPVYFPSLELCIWNFRTLVILLAIPFIEIKLIIFGSLFKSSRNPKDCILTIWTQKLENGDNVSFITVTIECSIEPIISSLDHISIGALGDSFYEYLLKAWLQSNREDDEARKMFDDAMKAVLKHMLRQSPSGLVYFTELKFDRPEEKMDHLGCFIGTSFKKQLTFAWPNTKFYFRWSSQFRSKNANERNVR